MSDIENEMMAYAISEFVNSMIGAYESGFVDRDVCTLAEIYRAAQLHVKDDYNIDMHDLELMWPGVEFTDGNTLDAKK